MPDDLPFPVQRWIDECTAPDASAAWLLCDRHDPAAAAFVCVEPDLTAATLTHGELAAASSRLAAALARRGVGAGDRVAALLSKRRELPVTLLALCRLGAVYVPLFTAFATPAIEARLRAADVRVVVTEPDQRAKLTTIDGLDVIEAGPEFEALCTDGDPLAEPAATGPDAPLLQLFTSGTTGEPKAVPVPVRALAAFRSYLHYGLDVTAGDVFWNAADPGWAYGLYYAVAGPLAHGRPSLLLRAGFSPDTTAAVIEKYKVTNFAGAPTMYRALMSAGTVLDHPLRRASSAGEPLTPDVPPWAEDALGCAVRDHYGQTELGMVIANAWHDDLREPVRPGSMGRALPGYTAGVRDGQIAIDTVNSPLMWFTGYLGAPARERWYLTGDSGRCDEDGHFFFTARDDDIILMAGYRIGPFDVESVLVQHPAVTEAAVVGRPDEIRGELLEAFVVLAAGAEGSPALETELQTLVRERYAAHAYPRRVHFVDHLPKTPSGKVQRFLLRRQPT